MESFDWQFYLDLYPDLKLAGINTKEKAEHHYINYGKNENRRTHQIIFSQNILDGIPSEKILSLASQAHISKGLSFLNTRFLNFFKLKKYFNKELPAIFFGIYTDSDLIKLKEHNNLKIIIWGGNDFNTELSHSKQTIKEVKLLDNVIHLSISKCIYNRLKANNVNSIYVKFNLVDKKLFKVIPQKNLGKCIFIYNGNSKGREHIYGYSIYQTIINNYPNLEFILSNELNLPYDKMPEIYQKCFLGLRLTDKDGNANTVQEFEAMNIPIFHNQSDYGLKWENSHTIIKYIDDIIHN